MLYKPRVPQMISAVQFCGNWADEDIQKLGITYVPSNMMGYCQCGRPFYEHGYCNGKMICPNTYIMYEGKQIVNVMSKENFESIYKPLIDIEDCTEVESTDANK